MSNAMTTILTFGKFKGQRFCDTPKWYQQWLNNQKWFAGFMSVNMSANTQPNDDAKDLHKRLAGWDGHSTKGQAIYDQIFEQEKAEADEQDRRSGWYEPGGMYYGI